MSTSSQRAGSSPALPSNPSRLAGFEDFLERFGAARPLSPVSSGPASQVSSAVASQISSPAKENRRRAGKAEAAGEFFFEKLSNTPRQARRRLKGPLSNPPSEEEEVYDEPDLSTFSTDEIVPAKKRQARPAMRKSKSAEDGRSVFGLNQVVISPGAADFHRACQFGHIASLEAMFRKGEVPDVNATDSLRNTGMHEAALNGHWEVVRLLLKRGGSLALRNLSEKTPIDLARTPSMGLMLTEFRERALLARQHRLIRLVWSGNLAGLKRAVQEEPSAANLDAADSLGFTALHAAALFDRTDMVQVLLTHGADIDVASPRGITPLHEACRFSSAEAVRFLLEANADASLRNTAGHLPVSMANKPIRRLYRRILKELGADDPELGVSEAFVHYEDLSDASGSDDDDDEPSDGSEDAELMFRSGPPAGVSREQRKLQHAVAIMDKQSPAKRGRGGKRAAPEPSSLDGAAEDSPYRAKPVAAPPASRAEEGARRAAPEKSRPGPGHRDKAGGALLLHKHARKGNAKEVRQLIRSSPGLVGAEDAAGLTALHEAAVRGHLLVLKRLLDAGANIDHAAKDGSTPLHGAAEHGHADIVAYLLQAGANRILRNGRGQAALDVAGTARIRGMLDVSEKRLAEPAPKPGRQKAKPPAEAPPPPAAAPAKEAPRTLLLDQHEPLLLVRVGEPSGWYFLSPQIEGLYCHARRTATAGPFKSKHKHLYALGLAAVQRQHLIASPMMKRLGDLKEFLADPASQTFLLDKDAVYVAFSDLGLSFGSTSVIYLDLQRILRSSLSSDTIATDLPPAAPPAPPAAVPLKLKMKMQRKGGQETSPPLGPLAPCEETIQVD